MSYLGGPTFKKITFKRAFLNQNKSVINKMYTSLTLERERFVEGAKKSEAISEARFFKATMSLAKTLAYQNGMKIFGFGILCSVSSVTIEYSGLRKKLRSVGLSSVMLKIWPLAESPDSRVCKAWIKKK